MIFKVTDRCLGAGLPVQRGGSVPPLRRGRWLGNWVMRRAESCYRAGGALLKLKARMRLASGVILGCFVLFAGLAQSQSPKSDWFRVPLDGGELHGSQWGFAAKGSKERPLKQICAVMGEIAPRDPGAGYVEASETTSCDSLLQATDSISMGSEFGTGSDATVLRTTLYPKEVRRVTFVLAGGEELTYRAKGIKVKNRKAKGIPFFRYLVAQFNAEACIQRIVSYDGRGRVIKREKGDKICPQGG